MRISSVIPTYTNHRPPDNLRILRFSSLPPTLVNLGSITITTRRVGTCHPHLFHPPFPTTPSSRPPFILFESINRHPSRTPWLEVKAKALVVKPPARRTRPQSLRNLTVQKLAYRYNCHPFPPTHSRISSLVHPPPMFLATRHLDQSV